MNKRTKARIEALLPNGIPRYVRVYDNGGESADRYTVVYGKKSITTERPHSFMYLAMSGLPYHPQGFCQHGENPNKPVDVNDHGFFPALGRKNHLGKRIAWADLPADCRKAAMEDYKNIWDLE
jgi:hypothetical protein